MTSAATPTSSPVSPAADRARRASLAWSRLVADGGAGIAIALSTAVAFALLFARPAATLVGDWWNDPEAGHGLLIAGVCLWLLWRSRRDIARRPDLLLGAGILLAAILLRYLSGLAAELYTMRLSMIGAAAGLVIYHLGWRQLLAWWLPFVLLVLSVPIPEVILGTVALPLQLEASQMGAALLDARHVPVQLAGNVIRLPGRDLFVAEACSGLRSLTALLSLGVLLGGLSLRHPVSRAIVVLATIPIAIAINAVRIFVTGFVIHFVSPDAGTGFMHFTEGWLMFLLAFGTLAALAALVGLAERRPPRRAADA